MTKQTYKVNGMHCASCAQIISKQIAKIEGISSCDINFATKQARIQYSSEEKSIDELNHSIYEL
jgi:Cu+-exporting ATPase